MTEHLQCRTTEDIELIGMARECRCVLPINARRVTMKKLLTLLFALALTCTLSAGVMAQEAGGMSQESKKTEKAEKKEAKKEKKNAKHAAKKEKKEEKKEMKDKQ